MLMSRNWLWWACRCVNPPVKKHGGNITGMLNWLTLHCGLMFDSNLPFDIFFRRTTLMKSWLSKWTNTVIVFLFLLVHNAALHPLRENLRSYNHTGCWLGVKRKVTPWGQSSACGSALVLCCNRIQTHRRFKGIWTCYLFGKPQYGNFRGNPLYQATKTTLKRELNGEKWDGGLRHLTCLFLVELCCFHVQCLEECSCRFSSFFTI